MAFRVGDTVVHPNYGAGVITEIRKRGFLGNEEKPYYSIQLLSQPETTILVALRNAAKVGLRPTVPQRRLGRVWRILRSQPAELPSNHKVRYEMLKDKVHSGDVYRIAEVLRDLAWRRKRKRKLTIRGKRVYDRGMEFLAGEIAGVQHREIDVAQRQISNTLSQSTAASPAA